MSKFTVTFNNGRSKQVSARKFTVQDGFVWFTDESGSPIALFAAGQVFHVEKDQDDSGAVKA